MKNKILALLTAMLTISAMPASAVYQSQDEIAFALRGMETEGCRYIAEENTVYVSPLAAAAGASVHIGMYIEADYADLVFLYAELRSDSEQVTFDDQSFHNPSAQYTEEKVSYTTEAGVTFETKLKPYCLGYLNSMNVYQPNTFGVSARFCPETNGFNVNWMYGYSQQNTLSATFFGSRSDEYSFIELDMDIAAGTSAGEYRVSFVSDEENIDESPTRLSSDDSLDTSTIIYNNFLPALKDLTIVVAEGGDANLDGKTDAEDAAAILVYSAAKGAGGSPKLYSADNETEERRAYFLADVNEYSTVCGEGDGTSLDAEDASAILRYAAISGTGEIPDWTEIVGN